MASTSGVRRVSHLRKSALRTAPRPSYYLSKDYSARKNVRKSLRGLDIVKTLSSRHPSSLVTTPQFPRHDTPDPNRRGRLIATPQTRCHDTPVPTGPKTGARPSQHT